MILFLLSGIVTNLRTKTFVTDGVVRSKEAGASHVSRLTSKRINAAITLAFVVLFASLAELAWLTALSSAGPWYDPGLSNQMYTITLLASALLAIALVVLAGTRSASLRRLAAALNAEILAHRRESKGVLLDARELVSLEEEREAARRERAGVASSVAGPLAVTIAFSTIAASMLPGTGGFLAAHYVVNTTFILFLSYGWGPLLAWAVVGIGQLYYHR